MATIPRLRYKERVLYEYRDLKYLHGVGQITVEERNHDAYYFAH